ncbi:MAG: protein kinase, partial [Acidobacteriota bacterium]
MTLSAGTRLGPYEILAPLGAGGMGEVYRAKDTRLGRDVAIKGLPDSLAHDADALARFEREAQLLAALDHPHIAGIHGLEESGGSRYLVLELVEGSTLADRLSAGPLSVEESLRLGAQIADALDAAHAKGIVHRDLKPGNIQITPDGRVKVLDFGLAKSVAVDTSAASCSPTVAATQQGTVLGTPAYMSPEQARGRPADKRSDIWSFGCVLYEMLAGRRAFPGETASDSLAAVLGKQPDWHRMPRSTPESVRHLLARCLEKDVERRPRDIGDARIEIENALAALSGHGSRSRALVAVVTAIAVAAIGILVWRERERSPVRAATALSQITIAEGIEEFPALSPDGAILVFSAEVGAVRKLFLRKLADGAEKRLTDGDSDDILPSWSPDGKMILFVRARQTGKKLEPGDVFGQYDGGDVWKIDVATASASRLVEDACNPVFSPEGGRIAVDAAFGAPRRIWITDASGLNPQQASTDTSEAVAHLRPRWSPDGKRIVFQNMERTKIDVRVLDLASKQLTWVTKDLFQNLQPVWAPSGRVIYFTSNRTGGYNLWSAAVSAEGKIAGQPLQLTAGAGQDVEAAVSRDGKRLAFAILKQNADLWKLPVDPASGKTTGPPQEVVSTTREDSRGAWSPDGQMIAFNSDRAGDTNLWLYSLRDGATRQLTKGPGGDYQAAWAPDGRTIAFFSSRAGNAEIWTVDVASGTITQLTKTPSIDINPF